MPSTLSFIWIASRTRACLWCASHHRPRAEPFPLTPPTQWSTPRSTSMKIGSLGWWTAVLRCPVALPATRCSCTACGTMTRIVMRTRDCGDCIAGSWAMGARRSTHSTMPSVREAAGLGGESEHALRHHIGAGLVPQLMGSVGGWRLEMLVEGAPPVGAWLAVSKGAPTEGGCELGTPQVLLSSEEDGEGAACPSCGGLW